MFPFCPVLILPKILVHPVSEAHRQRQPSLLTLRCCATSQIMPMLFKSCIQLQFQYRAGLYSPSPHRPRPPSGSIGHPQNLVVWCLSSSFVVFQAFSLNCLYPSVQLVLAVCCRPFVERARAISVFFRSVLLLLYNYCHVPLFWYCPALLLYNSLFTVTVLMFYMMMMMMMMMTLCSYNVLGLQIA